MSALIPALINLLMKGRGGGGGGGYGGGSGGGSGGRPQKSTEEKSDEYWTKYLMGGNNEDSLSGLGGRSSGSRSSGDTGRPMTWEQAMGKVGGK